MIQNIKNHIIVEKELEQTDDSDFKERENE